MAEQKRINFRKILICFLLPLVSQLAAVKADDCQQDFQAGALIVKLRHLVPSVHKQRPGSNITSDLIKRHYHPEISSIKRFRDSTLYRIYLKPGVDEMALIKRLKMDPAIKEVSLNYLARISESDAPETRWPDDPGLPYQYSLSNNGRLFHPDQAGDAVQGSDIKAVYGWHWSTADSGTIIAVLDSGIATSHEDLKNKLVQGYNAIEDNDQIEDDHGHGTQVASIAAAESDNGVGIAGVAWHARIMPVKVASADGYASYLSIGYGIRYAADHGAHVINISLGGYNPSFILEDACEYAYRKGCILVAASGNTGSAVLYPAAYDDYCVAVGATDFKDEIAPFSNFGPQIDIVAPGVMIYCATYDPMAPTRTDLYAWVSGTSYATPHVAGAAALLVSYKPWLSGTSIVKLMMITSDDINSDELPGVDDYAGYGRLNLKTLLSPYRLEQ